MQSSILLLKSSPIGLVHHDVIAMTASILKHRSIAMLVIVLVVMFFWLLFS